jgi:hypothetical protein
LSLSSPNGTTPPIENTTTTTTTAAPLPSIDLVDILASACELANARAAKILSVRAEQHAGLSITEFVELAKENWGFVTATESLANQVSFSWNPRY